MPPPGEVEGQLRLRKDSMRSIVPPLEEGGKRRILPIVQPLQSPGEERLQEERRVRVVKEGFRAIVRRLPEELWDEHIIILILGDDTGMDAIHGFENQIRRDADWAHWRDFRWYCQIGQLLEHCNFDGLLSEDADLLEAYNAEGGNEHGVEYRPICRIKLQDGVEVSQVIHPIRIVSMQQLRGSSLGDMSVQTRAMFPNGRQRFYYFIQDSCRNGTMYMYLAAKPSDPHGLIGIPLDDNNSSAVVRIKGALDTFLFTEYCCIGEHKIAPAQLYLNLKRAGISPTKTTATQKRISQLKHVNYWDVVFVDIASEVEFQTIFGISLSSYK
jgi:hypothetical protein